MFKFKKSIAAVLVFLMICSVETGLAGTYVLPSSVTQLDSEAFSGDTQLTEVTLKSGLTTIGSKCFYGCSNLYRINIPSSVTSIGSSCFSGCLSDMLIQTTPGSYAMKWARDNHVDFNANTTYRAVLIGQMYDGEDCYLGYAPKNDALITAISLQSAEGTPYDTNVWVDLSASDILSTIDLVFGDAQDQDVSFFFYSGHGVGDDDPAWNGALCGVGNTYVKVSELRKKLDTIKGRKIIVIDACHSGQLIDGESGTMARNKSTKSKDAANSFVNAFISAFSTQSRASDDYNRYYILTAAAADEVSQTTTVDDYPISVFTHFLAKGMGFDLSSVTYTGDLAADTNNSDAVSIRESYEYVLRNTANRVQTVQVFPSGCDWMSIVRAK
ncbi:MAG: leucine-rich repeat protein [Clostridia bacterium]|nr:leucine-rich repeat protein [Clostridia bacterium]